MSTESIAVPKGKTSERGSIAPALAVLVGVMALLWAPIVPELVSAWRGNDTLSHGPLIPLIAAVLLWARRDKLRDWTHQSIGGTILLVASALLHIASVWIDIAFLQALSLIGAAAGAIWHLGGWRAMLQTSGALGFLTFMIPWPTTLVERLAFPLQLTSSSYAALLGGLIGLPIQREGVHLSVQPNPDGEPLYSVLVARQCSGLTSLIVLLALGYLVSYHTPVKLGWKAVMVALIPPLALITNAVRLTLILWAGANHGEGFATWVHDHEAPVLLALCMVGLLGIRSAVLWWTDRKPETEERRGETTALVAG